LPEQQQLLGVHSFTAGHICCVAGKKAHGVVCRALGWQWLKLLLLNGKHKLPLPLHSGQSQTDAQ
jgi:hypothetical protein